MVEFGLNFSASAFGVSSVWMKIVRLACAEGTACRTVAWFRGCMVGLSRLFEDDIGVDRGASEKYRVDVDVARRWHLFVVAVDPVGRMSAFVRHRTADLLDILDWRVLPV